MTGSLEGLKVLDLSRFIAGPMCAMQLADMGADVVKVERKGKGEDTRQNKPQLNDQSLYFLSFNRNKRSLELDFRSAEGQAQLRQLISKADVLIENFRPGTMEKMGCGWETLHQLNPRLIMVRISGFGQNGPLAQRPCFDAIAQAMSGIMSISGQQDGPPTMAGTFMVDYASALYATIGTLAALNVRHATGRGQLVEASLLESAVSMLISAIPEQAQLGRTMSRVGNLDRFSAPVNSYQTADQRWVYLSAGTDALFSRLIDAMGRQDLMEDARFNNYHARLANNVAIDAVVADWVRSFPADDVVMLMDHAGVPCSAVATIDEVLKNPQLKARNQLVDIDHPTAGTYTTHGVTVSLSDTPGSIRRAPPVLGAHTDEVLSEWGIKRGEQHGSY
ncbi:MAG: CoA transferase [Enterobacterales bacterium endosymbiont of Blomia tropicalis]|uniref:CaiB/BaiF CoA transferase family protein n=1 Tax=Mixta mediterraneensis TaxID=2758443 RepID=UPI0025A889C8|nr:CoA transferase [Mixta mediterraneensis]MDL4915111.1 CoA transferase [Mixta mediterraneensis]